MTDPEPLPDSKPVPPPPPTLAAPPPSPPEAKPEPRPKPETAGPAAPRPPASPPAAPVPDKHRPGRNPLAVLTAIGLAIAFAGIAYLWQQVATLPRNELDPARLAGLESQVRSLQQRLDVVERRPEPQPATPAPPPAPAPAPKVDLGPLEARISALEQRPAPSAPPPAPDLGPIEARLAKAEDASRRALALQSAAAALDAGRPLGTIPGAPPALARFATAAPPTLASLREAFTAAAAGARAASAPPPPPGLAAQVWQRLAGLVTVRRGASVLVGSPAAYILGEARQRLDAGDLAGALDALDALDPAAASAMAGWRDQAKALLDARAALAAG